MNYFIYGFFQQGTPLGVGYYTSNKNQHQQWEKDDSSNFYISIGYIF